MNRIFLNNFPYPSQQVVVSNTANRAEKKTFIHGFDGPIATDIVRPRLVSDFLQAVLVHDCIAIEAAAVSSLVAMFGFSDTIKLFNSGCLELIDHNGFSPILMREGSNFIVEFAQSGTLSQPTSDLIRVERHLKKHHPNRTSEINCLLLQAEANRKPTVLTTEVKQTLLNEIDFDLKNKTLAAACGVTSVSSKAILPADVYKVLRLLFINKSLFLGNSIDAVAIKVDGAAKSLLGKKLSPLMLQSTAHNTIDLFQQVLGDKKVPDLGPLYLERIMTMDDVLSLRDSIHGEKFRQWYLTTNYDSEQVYELLLAKNISQPILTKLLRFIIPNAIGIGNAWAGIVADAVDSFIIEKILGGWHPNLFLDDLLKAEIDSLIKAHDAVARRHVIEGRFPNIGRNDRCPCGSRKKFALLKRFAAALVRYRRRV